VGTALVLATAAGCDKKPAPEGAAPSASQFTEVDKVALMEKHYQSAIAAHDALIRGDLPAFRERVAALSTQALPPNAPAGWKAPHDRLLALAKEASSADDVPKAAASMASVVEACGSCHASQSQGPVYRKPHPSWSDTELKTKMLGHQWATERLWEGVTGPWDDAWRRGAAEVARTRLFPEDAGVGQTLRDQEAALRAVGDEAAKATELGARAKIYGRLLGGCADCHRAARVEFKGRSGAK
jgi:cytochrome c553